MMSGLLSVSSSVLSGWASGSPDSSDESDCAAVLVNPLVLMSLGPAAPSNMRSGAGALRQPSGQGGPDGQDEGGIADEEHRSDEEDAVDPGVGDERRLNPPAPNGAVRMGIATGAMQTI